MSKTKKVLSIIFISLLILSTILTLCKKVGLCASSDPNYSVLSSFPLSYNVNQGLDGFSISTSTCESIINDSLSRMSGYPFGVFTSELASDRSFLNVQVIYMPDDWGGNAASGSVPSSMTPGPNVSIECLRKGFTSYKVFPDGTFQFISITNASGSFWWRLNDVCPSNSTIYNRFFTSGWPIYLTSYGQSNTLYYQYQNTGIPVFQYVPASGGASSGGHTKGGVLGNFIDSEQLLEDSSDMPSFDFTPPITQQGFWDKLFGFFSRSFKTFNSWLLTIGDLISQVIDKLEEVYNKIEEFFGRVFETIFSWLESIFDKLGSSDDHLDQVEDNTSGLPSFITSSTSWMSNFWGNFKSNLEDFVENRLWNKLPDIMKAPFRIASWFYTHGLNNGEFDFLTLWEYLFDFDSQTAYNLWSNNKYGDFILDVRDFFSNFISSITGVTASDRVFFIISLGDHFGVYIPDIEIDFSWYANIRDTFLPYLMAFLYVSVVWLFFKRLPDILKGIAGAESSFEDNLPQHFSNAHYDQNSHVMSVTSGTRTKSGTRSTTNRTTLRW